MSIDVNTLKQTHRQLWLNIRNYLYPMTVAEIQVELDLSIKQGDFIRAAFVREYIRECGE